MEEVRESGVDDVGVLVHVTVQAMLGESEAEAVRAMRELSKQPPAAVLPELLWQISERADQWGELPLPIVDGFGDDVQAVVQAVRQQDLNALTAACGNDFASVLTKLVAVAAALTRR